LILGILRSGSNPSRLKRHNSNRTNSLSNSHPTFVQSRVKEFITHRLDGKLNPLTESEAKGHGGYRPGAGRPQGTTKEPTERLSLPLDIAEWIKEKRHWPDVRRLMSKEKAT
jgi:hypothetical protein